MTEKNIAPSCFHCNYMIYDVGELYQRKLNGELYCTNCNISIKDCAKAVENV